MQAFKHFLVSFWEMRSDLFSQNGGVETWQGGVQKFQKIGQTIFLESGGLAGRQFAGFDGVDGAAGDDGSRGIEEVGFGFGVGGEVGGGAREVEEISGRILQAGQCFSVSF